MSDNERIATAAADAAGRERAKITTEKRGEVDALRAQLKSVTNQIHPLKMNLTTFEARPAYVQGLIKDLTRKLAGNPPGLNNLTREIYTQLALLDCELKHAKEVTEAYRKNVEALEERRRDLEARIMEAEDNGIA